MTEVILELHPTGNMGTPRQTPGGPPTSINMENKDVINIGKLGVGTDNPGTNLAAVGLPIYGSNNWAKYAGLQPGDFYRLAPAGGFGLENSVVCVVY